MAVAGMILGIIGVVFAFIPVFGAFVAIPCVGVGMPLAAVAFYQARKKKFHRFGTTIVASSRLTAIGWGRIRVQPGRDRARQQG